MFLFDLFLKLLLCLCLDRCLHLCHFVNILSNLLLLPLLLLNKNPQKTRKEMECELLVFSVN